MSINHTAGLFGDAAVAAIAIVQRAYNLGISALMGFGQGFQPICGYNYGAECYDRSSRPFPSAPS